MVIAELADVANVGILQDDRDRSPERMLCNPLYRTNLQLRCHLRYSPGAGFRNGSREGAAAQTLAQVGIRE